MPPTRPEREAIPRQRYAWLLRASGWSYDQIGAEVGTTRTRARQIVMRAEQIMQDALGVYHVPYEGELAEGVWHVFTPDGRVADLLPVPYYRYRVWDHPTLHISRDNACKLAQAAAVLEAAAT